MRHTRSAPHRGAADMNATRKRLAGTLVLSAMMAVTILPLLSLLSAALQPQGSVPYGLAWPAHPHWENFADAWNAANMAALLKSSVLIVVGVVPISLTLATL